MVMGDMADYLIDSFLDDPFFINENSFSSMPESMLMEQLKVLLKDNTYKDKYALMMRDIRDKYFKYNDYKLSAKQRKAVEIHLLKRANQ